MGSSRFIGSPPDVCSEDVSHVWETDVAKNAESYPRLLIVNLDGGGLLFLTREINRVPELTPQKTVLETQEPGKSLQ